MKKIISFLAAVSIFVCSTAASAIIEQSITVIDENGSTTTKQVVADDSVLVLNPGEQVSAKNGRSENLIMNAAEQSINQNRFGVYYSIDLYNENSAEPFAHFDVTETGIKQFTLVRWKRCLPERTIR
ncbi:MAG: hypothetical protein J1F64_11435 [Oscillospiraceae bacterium]|nr:hypothetical protein [Oscillospiraceae bacterium]